MMEKEEQWRVLMERLISRINSTRLFFFPCKLFQRRLFTKKKTHIFKRGWNDPYGKLSRFEKKKGTDDWQIIERERKKKRKPLPYFIFFSVCCCSNRRVVVLRPFCGREEKCLTRDQKHGLPVTKLCCGDLLFFSTLFFFFSCKIRKNNNNKPQFQRYSWKFF